MSTVQVSTARPLLLAAVHREVPASAVGSSWKPALDLVWEFLRSRPGLWAGGHNVFVYRAGAGDGLLECDFGVEVARPFEPSGEVRQVSVPEGQAAVAIHRGTYDGLHDAYDAIDEWMREHWRSDGGWTWEIYGDPAPDPEQTETTVARLLKPL